MKSSVLRCRSACTTPPALRCRRGWAGSLPTLRLAADRSDVATPSGGSQLWGPFASRLIGAETDVDVFGPMRALVEENGTVLLMGVGLTRMTLLHLAEVEAGRRPFVRWAAAAAAVRSGCERGRAQRASSPWRPRLATVERHLVVGRSHWRVFPAREAVGLAANTIRENPWITHCPNPECIELPNTIAGGPLE